MIKIKKTSISITRGDSAYISFALTNADGNPIDLSTEDKVRCQVRKEPVTGELLFDGEITQSDEEGVIWHIRPEDTAELEVGEYFWDAQIEYADGDIFTFVDVSAFNVLPEVTLGRG